MQINDAIIKFSNQMRADGRSPNTISQYQRQLLQFAKWLSDTGGDADIQKINAETLAAFLNSPGATIQKTGVHKKSSSMNALRATLRCFFSFSVRAGWTTANAGYLLRRAKTQPRPPRALSPDEQNRLLTKLAAETSPEAKRDYLLFHLLLATGIRLGSALALDWRDINFARAELLLTKTKGDRPEIIVVPPPLLQHLAEARTARFAGPLFTNRQGGRLSSRHVQRRLKYWLSSAGVLSVASPHSLRHSFAMNLYHSTRDILLVKSAMKHQSISSTQIYTKLDDHDVRNAVSAVDPGKELWKSETNDTEQRANGSVA